MLPWLLLFAAVAVGLILAKQYLAVATRADPGSQGPGSKDAPPASQPLPPAPQPTAAMYLVLRGPDKGLLVRLGPFARLGGPGSEGTWICVDPARRIHVRVEGLDSQLGMVLLDLWALLGEVEARATLERPCLVLPEPELAAHEAELGGYRAMEGWLLVPSLVSYQPPEPDEIPRIVALKLSLPGTSVQMFMERGRLLEIAARRTHPTAAPRESRPPAASRPPETAAEVAELLGMVMARYESNPTLALAMLEQAFPMGLPGEPRLAAAICQAWGLCLRNVRRFDEALTRFDQGLALVEDDGARQELLYNRGYARLRSMMSQQRALGGQLYQSAFHLEPRHRAPTEACLADFQEATRLDPEDEDAQSQVQVCEQLLSALDSA